MLKRGENLPQDFMMNESKSQPDIQMTQQRDSNQSQQRMEDQQQYRPQYQERRRDDYRPNHDAYSPPNQGYHSNCEEYSPPNRDNKSKRGGYSPLNRSYHSNREGHSPPNRGNLSNRGGYSSPPCNNYHPHNSYNNNRGGFNRGGGRGGFRNANYSQRCDKQVSTHNNNNHHHHQQQQQQQHFGQHNKRGGFFGNSFSMPPQIPPFSGHNQRNNNRKFNNKQITVRPSTSVANQSIPEEDFERSVPKSKSLEVLNDDILEVPAAPLSISKSESTLTEELCKESCTDPINSPEEVDEITNECTQVVETECAIEQTECAAENVEEKDKFYRYTIDKLYELKEGNSLIALKPSDLKYPLISDKLENDVRRILFDKDLILNEEEYTSRRHNNSFGKSGQLSKRNSGELRRADSFTGNNSRRGTKGPSPNNSSTNIDENSMIRISLADVKLNEAKDAWKPAHLRAKESTNDAQKEIDVLCKAFRSHLNKMTEENFDLILPDIKKMKLDTMEKLDSVVGILFEKSISEPGFASMYARLCKVVALMHSVPDESKDEKSKTRNSLKKILIMRCQTEFEKAPENNALYQAINQRIKDLKVLLKKTEDFEGQLNTLPVEKLAQMRDNLEEIEDTIEESDKYLELIAEKFNKNHISVIRANDDKSILKDWTKRLVSYLVNEIDEFECFQSYMRRRATGTVKFIGELFKVELLTPKIMFGCINSLFGPDDTKVSDDSMERLSKLLVVIGPGLEKYDFNSLNEVFKRLKRIIDINVPLETRVRFEIQNVIDLRKQKWIPSKNLRSSEINPMKLNEFEDTMRRQEVEKQMQAQEYDRQHHYNNQSYNNQRRGGQHNQHHQQQSRSQGSKYQKDSDGFIINSGRNTFDMSRLPTLSRGNTEGEIRLGPQLHFSGFLGRGQIQTPPPPIASNPFSQLREDSDGTDVKSDSFASGRNNGRGRRNNNNNRYNNQHEQQSQRTNNFKVTVLPLNQTMPNLSTASESPKVEGKLKKMPQENFENIINDFIAGKLKFDQCTEKLQGFCVDEDSISSVFSMHLIDNQDEGFWIAKVINHMTNLSKEFVTKEAIIGGLKFAWEEAPNIKIDNPLVYPFLEEYFLELRKGIYLTRDDIENFFETTEDKLKFPRIFDTAGNYIIEKSETPEISGAESEKEDEESRVETMTLTSSESNTPVSSPSTVYDTPEVQGQPEKFSTPQAASSDTRLSEKDILQPPEGITVGKFANIIKKFKYSLEKCMKKKQNIDQIFKMIEDENCKYDKTFICEFTDEVLKMSCQLAKSNRSALERYLANCSDILKRYLDNNITQELYCISAIQAFVYSNRNIYPGN